MKKGILTLSLALSLAFSSLVCQPVLASDFTVTPRAALCSDCNQGQMISKGTTYTSWYLDHYASCTHGDNRVNDRIMKRVGTTVYQCSNSHCGNGYSKTTSQTKRVHPKN